MFQPHTNEQFKANVPNFKTSEFAEDPIKQSDPTSLIKLQKFRIALGSSISPSLAPGALARFDKESGSKHTVNIDKGILSTAFDLFFDANPEYVLFKLFTESEFNGIGIYFDTKNNKGIKQVMFHVDSREKRTTQSRINGIYSYVTPDNNTLKTIFKMLI